MASTAVLFSSCALFGAVARSLRSQFTRMHSCRSNSLLCTCSGQTRSGIEDASDDEVKQLGTSDPGSGAAVCVDTGGDFDPVSGAAVFEDAFSVHLHSRLQ